jgi:hypothetical protein
MTLEEASTMPGFPPRGHLKGGQNAAPVNRALAREFYAPIIPIVVELRRQGLSLRAIARELDRRGIRTRQVGWYKAGASVMEVIRWSATQVKRVLARAAGSGPAPAASVTPSPGVGPAEPPERLSPPAVGEGAGTAPTTPEDRLQRHGYRLACRRAGGSDLWHTPQGDIVLTADALARLDAPGSGPPTPPTPAEASLATPTLDPKPSGKVGELLERCRALGCCPVVAGGKLRLYGFDTASVHALRRELLTHEAEVVRVLSETPQSGRST